MQEVVDAGLRFLRGLGFHGISQVEFKRDPRDGRFKLMEINPRLWQWHGLAAACGVDLPLIAYRDLTGEPRRAGLDERVGQALGDLRHARRAACRSAAAVRRRRLREGRPPARARAHGPGRARRVP